MTESKNVNNNAVTASNVGTGEGSVFKQKTSEIIELKTLKAGTSITITDNASDITIDSITTSPKDFLQYGVSNTVAGGNGTEYIFPWAVGTVSGSEARTKVYLPFAGTIIQLDVYCDNNTSNGTNTITIMKNNSAQLMTLQYTSGQTGRKSTTSNPITFATGDYIEVKRFDSGSSGGFGPWRAVIVYQQS